MLAVEVLINGRIVARHTARNIGRLPEKPNSAWRLYETDDGKVIRHNRKDGAEALATQLLLNPTTKAKEEKREIMKQPTFDEQAREHLRKLEGE